MLSVSPPSFRMQESGALALEFRVWGMIPSERPQSSLVICGGHYWGSGMAQVAWFIGVLVTVTIRARIQIPSGLSGVFV